MNIGDLVILCEAYDKLGSAVQSQVRVVLAGEAIEDQNPNALRLARRQFIDVARRRGIDVSEWDDVMDASKD